MHENHYKYLDLKKIRLPIPGITSILHRITGIVLFIGLPFLLWLLWGTLNQKEIFENYQLIISYPLIKIILILFLWAFLHHMFAGIRFLLLDLHIGISLPTARLTAKLVLFLAPLLALIIGAYLW